MVGVEGGGRSRGSSPTPNSTNNACKLPPLQEIGPDYTPGITISPISGMQLQCVSVHRNAETLDPEVSALATMIYDYICHIPIFHTDTKTRDLAALDPTSRVSAKAASGSPRQLSHSTCRVKTNSPVMTAVTVIQGRTKHVQWSLCAHSFFRFGRLRPVYTERFVCRLNLAS